MPVDVLLVDCALQLELPRLLSTLIVLRFSKMPVNLLLYNSRALPLTANDRKINRPVEKKTSVMKCLNGLPKPQLQNNFNRTFE